MSAYSGISGEINSLAQMRAPSVPKPESALEEVAGHFEALFTRMMLKSMRESSLNSGLFESNQSSQYTEMFDDQVATQMSRGRGLGLKEILIRQLEQFSPAEPAPQAAEPTQRSADWRPDSKGSFISGLMPFARQVEKEIGVSHKAVIAQAALESGWGRHTIRNSDGTNSFNLFGIKADSSWHGEKATVQTLEFEDGVAQRRTASFRSYRSMTDAACDYAAFIRDNPRYEQAITHGADPQAYARELQSAGYATDPDYAKKIGEILDNNILSAPARTASLSTNLMGVMQ